MKPTVGVPCVLLAMACSVLSDAAPALSTLQPGKFQTLQKEVPVNIVFVGYEPGTEVREINDARFRSFLPQTYTVRNRYPAFYGLASDAGLKFTFKYNIVYAPQAFEDSFFAYLTSIGVKGALTFYQGEYNKMAKRSATIPAGENYTISATATEKWLADNAGSLAGVNPARYTVFFVNWFGRSDFKYHVYAKTNENDPDTNFAFGNLSSRKTIAWGGSAANDPNDGPGTVQRVWFYDLSAGPEWWAGNYDVDNIDVTGVGNGVRDYRIPPSWEYGSVKGYRPFTDLSGDLGRVTRFVAIDLLFTTSPLYKPAISAPKIPQAVQLDVNMFDQGTLNSPALFKGNMAAENLGRLQPLNAFSTQVSRYQLDNRVSDVFNCFIADQRSCYGSKLFGIAFGDLFLYFNDHLLQYIDNNTDYELPIFTFNTASSSGGLLGFADDNWRDGTQSFVFGFLDPATRQRYGFTSTLIHEAGHHLGMSHPHDGYDSELNIDFGPSDSFYFAWSGDESSTMMSYMDLNYDFSQFDQDNMNRYLTAVYLNQANQVLARVLASPLAGQVAGSITAADTQAAAAVTAFNGWNYPGAASNALAAYRTLLDAAAKIRVQIEPQASQADYRSKGKSFSFVDPVDYHRFPVEPPK